MTQVTLPNRIALALLDAAADAGIVAPVSVSPDATFRQSTITWTPDLSPTDITTLQTLRSLVVGASLLTVAERNGIQSDIDLLVAFQGIATPTLAQTVAATKAQSRILRAILRS